MTTKGDCSSVSPTTSANNAPGNQDQSPKEETKNSLATLTPEIWEQIFGELDFERQKVCRLVSKGWNEEICRIFRSKHVTTYGYTCGGGYRFSDHYMNPKRREALPCPFHSFKLQLLTGTATDVQNLCLKFPHIQVSKLTFLEDEAAWTKLQLKRVISLFKHCAPTLAHLNTHYWLTECKLEFPQLKVLSIFIPTSPKDTPADQVSFFASVIANSPNLTQLRIIGTTGVSDYVHLLGQSNVRKLERLAIYAQEEGVEQDKLLEALSTWQVDCLKCLVIEFYVNELTNVSVLLNIISRHSKSLQLLKLRVEHYLWDDFPVCPLLTHLSLSDLLLGRLDFRKLPSLKSFTVHYTSAPDPDIEMDSIRMFPAAGVEHVSINNLTCSDYFDCLFPHTTLAMLFDLFPNAQHWEVLRYDYFLLFHEEALSRLQGRIKRLGIQNCKWDRSSVEEQKRITTCLEQLEGLEELDLYDLEDSCCNLQTVDVSKLKSLKVLRLRWSDLCSGRIAALAKKHKGLQKLILMDGMDPRWDEQLARLFAQVPILSMETQEDHFA